VQTAALTLALEGAGAVNPDEVNLARLLSIEDMHSEDRQRRAWAYGNAIELDLLSICSRHPLVGELPKWRESVDQLVRAVGMRAPEVLSTRAQLLRWMQMFAPVRVLTASAQQVDNEPQWPEIVALAERMCARLPSAAFLGIG
jgi:hypothetical protein